MSSAAFCNHCDRIFFNLRFTEALRHIGLGLALCKSIIHAHGGDISVRDNRPHGTIFTFTLPAEEVILHE